MNDSHRLQAAHERLVEDVIAYRHDEGYWPGELAASALSTATAISALAVVRKHGGDGEGILRDGGQGRALDGLIATGIDWLSQRQNRDGGWGDTDLSHSNIATTMLVMAAFRLADLAEQYRVSLDRARNYVHDQGGIDGLRRRYGRDKTFAVPILANCALAGEVDWQEVSALPFELACFPQSWYHALRLPVVSYAIPALVAVGQSVFFHRRPRNLLVNWLRRAAVPPSLRVIQRMQPASGGFLEAIPLTSFVAMSLAATGRGGHRVTERAVEFLRQTVRPDGSWPIDTNLATWNTTLAINALGVNIDRVRDLRSTTQWLLDCQQTARHAFTGAAPGGWGWTDTSGAVPDVDDTAGALLALDSIRRRTALPEVERARIKQAAADGVRWLLSLQNHDGGWPTFCRGWGRLPFDRSGTDLTAHALRALARWAEHMPHTTRERATSAGLDFLRDRQTPAGSWAPLWFGNQEEPQEENPYYGTARALLAFRDLGMLSDRSARRGVRWLVLHQNLDGGWGGGWGHQGEGAAAGQKRSSIEESSVVLEALLANYDEPAVQPAVKRGVDWLLTAIEAGEHRRCSPIGLYFAKLWYYETMYPLNFALAALTASRKLW